MRMTKLSDADKKELARLVGLYGADAIVAEAQHHAEPPPAPPRVRRRSRGRPPHSSKKWSKDSDVWTDIEWIDRRAEELEASGEAKQTSKQRATVELFTKRFPRSESEQADKDFAKFEKYIRNGRDKWRPTERAMKVAGSKRLEIRNAKRLFKAR
jgi:hypothetical protein